MMRSKAFTLIELLVVIAVIGILSTLVLVYLGDTQGKAKVAKGFNLANSIEHALGSNLIGRWDFDNSATDTSGYNSNCTLYGATYSTSTPQAVVGSGAGKYSLSFDGGDYATCGNSTTLKNPSDDFTIEAWVYPDGIVDTYADILHTGWYRFQYRTSDAKIIIWFNDGTGFKVVALSNTPLENRNWYHLVGVWKPGTGITQGEIYINGQLDKASSYSAVPVQSNGGLWVGAWNSSTYRWIGLIDNIRIYDQGLSAAEIKKHYAEESPKHGVVFNR